MLLADPQETRGGLTHLPDGSRRRAEVGRVQRLHGIDDAHVGALALEGRAHVVEIRLGEHQDVGGSAEPLGPELHLRARLLAGDKKRLALGAHGRAPSGAALTCRSPDRR